MQRCQCFVTVKLSRDSCECTAHLGFPNARSAADSDNLALLNHMCVHLLHLDLKTDGQYREAKVGHLARCSNACAPKPTISARFSAFARKHQSGVQQLIGASGQNTAVAQDTFCGDSKIGNWNRVQTSDRSPIHSNHHIKHKFNASRTYKQRKQRRVLLYLSAGEAGKP